MYVNIWLSMHVIFVVLCVKGYLYPVGLLWKENRNIVKNVYGTLNQCIKSNHMD